MVDERDSGKPIEHAVLSKREGLPAEGEPQGSTVPLFEFPADAVERARIVEEHGRMRLVAEVTVDGLPRRREQIRVKRLKADEVDPTLAERPIEGYRPAGVPTRFLPTLAEATHTLPARKGKDPDPGGTIFGSDDRYLFDDTSYPCGPPARCRPSASGGQGQPSARATY
jgi:hypothetical protein